MINYIFIAFTLLTISACEPTHHDSVLRKHEQDDLRTQLSPEKTTVIAVFARDAFANSKAFKRWDELEKTRGLVHIFAHPNSSYEWDEYGGIKHFVPIEDLAKEITKTLIETKTTRVIIFINTHGASSGNLCYENQKTCSLTENFLASALLSYRPHAEQTKEVLIVPLSCFNRPIMDRFIAKVKGSTWPFALSIATQKINEASGTQSTGETLLENNLIPIDTMSDADIDEGLAITKLEEFIAFNNRFMADIEELTYELIHVSQPAAPLMLANFGFDIGLQTVIKKNDHPKLFPEGERVDTFLESINFSTHRYDNLSSLIIDLEDLPQVDVAVDGKTHQRITNPKLVNARYTQVQAVLRPSLH